MTLLKAAKAAEHAITEVVGKDDEALSELANIEKALGTTFEKSRALAKLLQSARDLLRAAITAEKARLEKVAKESESEASNWVLPDSLPAKQLRNIAAMARCEEEKDDRK